MNRIEGKVAIVTGAGRRGGLGAAIARKPKGHDFDYSRQTVAGQMSRHMSHTGG